MKRSKFLASLRRGLWRDRKGATAVFFAAMIPGLVGMAGLTVDVGRTPQRDERFSDPQFAVSDAFRRARRRLQDRAKVMRHEVKALHKRMDRSLDRPD